MTTGHSSPLAAWQVAIVTFCRDDTDKYHQDERQKLKEQTSLLSASLLLSPSEDSVEAWRNDRRGVVLSINVNVVRLI